MNVHTHFLELFVVLFFRVSIPVLAISISSVRLYIIHARMYYLYRTFIFARNLKEAVFLMVLLVIHHRKRLYQNESRRHVFPLFSSFSFSYVVHAFRLEIGPKNILTSLSSSSTSTHQIKRYTSLDDNEIFKLTGKK